MAFDEYKKETLRNNPLKRRGSGRGSSSNVGRNKLRTKVPLVSTRRKKKPISEEDNIKNKVFVRKILGDSGVSTYNDNNPSLREVKGTVKRKLTSSPPPAYMNRGPNQTSKETLVSNARRIQESGTLGHEYWQRFGAQEKTRQKTTPVQYGPKDGPNTFTQTGGGARRSLRGKTGTVSNGIKFGPRDSTLGRERLGLPTRAQENAGRRGSSSSPRERNLKFGQTMLNMPASNEAKMRSRDTERMFEKQLRRSRNEGAVVGDRNARSFDSFMGNRTSTDNSIRLNNTSLRGQDINAGTQRRGQDIGQETQFRGQDVTARGQDISANTSIRGQDNQFDIASMNDQTTRRGQDSTEFTTLRSQDVTMRGQNNLADMASRRDQSYENVAAANNRQRQYDTDNRSAASKYASDIVNDRETRNDAIAQLKRFNTEEGEEDQQRTARNIAVMDDLIANGFKPTNMQQIIQATNILDQFNEGKPSNSKDYMTAASLSELVQDPEGKVSRRYKAELVKLKFWDKIFSFNFGSEDQYSVDDIGYVPEDEIGPMDSSLRDHFGLEQPRR